MAEENRRTRATILCFRLIPLWSDLPKTTQPSWLGTLDFDTIIGAEIIDVPKQRKTELRKSRSSNGSHVDADAATRKYH